MDTVYVDAEPLRARLVAVGVELLERDGMGGVGLRAIARAAGVSHGAPRRYFPTHAALLGAIAAAGLADLRARLAPVLEMAGSADARTVELATRYIEFAVARPKMFALMFCHDLLEGSGAQLRILSVPMFEAFEALIGGAGTQRRRRALAIFAGVHGLAAMAANRSLELLDPTADVSATVEAIVRAHL